MKFTWINFHVTNQENGLLEGMSLPLYRIAVTIFLYLSFWFLFHFVSLYMKLFQMKTSGLEFS